MFSLRSLFYQLYQITGHFSLTHWLEHLQSKMLWIKTHLKCIFRVRIIHVMFSHFAWGFSKALFHCKKIV